MKKIIIIVCMFMMTVSAFAHPEGPGVSNAKAMELAAHRVDRLVTLGKIEGSFLKQLEKIEIAIVQDQAPIYYKVRISQIPPGQGAPMQLDISFNEEGKALDFQVLSGGVGGPDAGWTGIDAVSLVENALHYILENSGDAKMIPFDKGISSITLSKEMLNGESVAHTQATSNLTSDKLNIYLKLNGSFISAEMTP
ncbi:MAG TPA: hypothetical protein VIG33_15215 [Pseudobdellovibrionaceae bacterium]|jgi:hypothetical protein